MAAAMRRSVPSLDTGLMPMPDVSGNRTLLKALGNSQTDDASKPELLQQIIKTIRGFLDGMYLGKK